MEDHTVTVLRIGEDLPATRSVQRIPVSSTHISFKAAVTARAVIARLTQGPQRIVPAMTAIAKTGQNDLPNTSTVCDSNGCDRNVRDGRVMVLFCPLRLNFAVQCISRKELSQPRHSNLPGRRSARQWWGTRNPPNLPAILSRIVTM
jgi:hypothetical protein